MLVYYFDSSAAVKRYTAEKGSRWIKDIVEPAAENFIYLGQIGVVEIAAALSKKVRTKELMQDDYEAALQLFLTDVQNQEYLKSVNSYKTFQFSSSLIYWLYCSELF